MHLNRTRFLRKRYVIPSIATVVALAAAGAAFAYFTSSGSGTGSAQVGKVTPFVINQTGFSAYNSTLAPNSYVQDQCFECAGISELGNAVNLASSGVLSNVVVSLRNWTVEPAFSWPITFTIYSPGTGSPASVGAVIASDTQTFTIPATTTSPTPFNITFDNFTYTAGYPSPLPTNIIYGISFNTSDYGSPPSSTNYADGLNVALSSSSTDVSVGSDTYGGIIYVNAVNNGGLQSDAGTCVNPTWGTFSPSDVWCGTTPPGGTPYANVGAYGNSSGADIPAVQINLSGTGNLYPNGPAQQINFTVTNPGSIPETLNSVTISVAEDTNGLVEATPGDPSTDVTGCSATWFTGSSVGFGGESIAAGQTVSGTGTVSMTDSGTNQDPCQGAAIGLTFAAS